MQMGRKREKQEASYEMRERELCGGKAMNETKSYTLMAREERYSENNAKEGRKGKRRRRRRQKLLMRAENWGPFYRNDRFPIHM